MGENGHALGITFGYAVVGTLAFLAFVVAPLVYALFFAPEGGQVVVR